MIEIGFIITYGIAMLVIGVLIGARYANLRFVSNPNDPIDSVPEAIVVLAKEAKSKGTDLIEYIREKT